MTVDLQDLAGCCEGAIPMVLATASADGVPNVTYLSRAHIVDGERIALSDQFLSKSARNLAENPRASLIMMDPADHREFRLTITYERTERRGPLFDRLRRDVDSVAALTGMQDVFRLRAASIYRVVEVEPLGWTRAAQLELAPTRVPPPDPLALAELCTRLGRCADLDALVRMTVDGLADLLGYEHSMLLLLDEGGTHLFTIASRGYATEGVGSEVPLGEGILGTAAAQGAPVRVGNLLQMDKYARTLRRSYEEAGGIGPGHEVPLPAIADVESRLAVPALALGQVVGVLAVESERPARFSDVDAATLTMVATVLAGAVETVRSEERSSEASRPAPAAAPAPRPVAASTHVRFFPVDGSTFLDGDYLIKGVAGRLLWSLLGQHEREGRTDFTNREVRLDPSLDLPDFRDNFESRLILLKRRLDEREAPVRIAKTGRGRFRLDVVGPLRLEEVGPPRR